MAAMLMCVFIIQVTQSLVHLQDRQLPSFDRTSSNTLVHNAGQVWQSKQVKIRVTLSSAADASTANAHIATPA